MTDVQLVVSICMLFLPILIVFAHAEVDEICQRLESNSVRTIHAAERCAAMIQQELREANRLRNVLGQEVNILVSRLSK